MENLTALVAATPAEWIVGIQDVAPVVTLFIAAIAIIPAWVAIVKTAKSNRQGRWWSEVQWALDAAFSENPVKQKAGIRTIFILSREKWLGQHELQVLDSAWEQSLVQSATGGLRGRTSGPTPERRLLAEGTPGEEASPEAERNATDTDAVSASEADGEVQVEAAKLRVALDARMERETPTWIKARAKD